MVLTWKTSSNEVIAVDVESPLKKRKRLNTALSILEQTIGLLGLEQRQKNEKFADIHIRPDLTGFTTGDFGNDKIKKIVQRGIAAARKNINQFVTLKKKHQLYRMEYPTIIDLANKHPRIYGLQITGHTAIPFIYQLLGIRPGTQLDTDNLNRRIMEAYGLGYFEYIKYEIEPIGENKVVLNLKVKELPSQRLRVGLRYDDFFKLVGAVNVLGINWFVPGLRFENEFQFAGFVKLDSKIYYPARTLNLPVYPLVNFGFRDVPINIFNGFSGDLIASYKDRSTHVGLGLGLLFAKSFNIEIEYQHEYMNITPNIAFSDPTMFPTWKDKLRKLQVSLTWDMLDDVLLPRNGYKISGYYEGSYKKLKSDLEYSYIWTSANIYLTFFRHHTTRLFAFYGTCRSSPIYKLLNLGKPEFFVGPRKKQNLVYFILDYKF